MLFSTMPIESVSCSRNAICRVVNSVTDASSITALTSFSNSTGRTTMFCGTTLNSAEPIGTAWAGMVVISMRRLSIAHCPTRPSPKPSRGGWPCAPSSANAESSRRLGCSSVSTW